MTEMTDKDMEVTFRIASAWLIVEWLSTLTVMAALCIVPIRAGIALWRRGSPFGSDVTHWLLYVLVVAILASTVALAVVVARNLLVSPVLRCSALTITKTGITFVSRSGTASLVIDRDLRVAKHKSGLRIGWRANGTRRSIVLAKRLFSESDFGEIRERLMSKYGAT